MTDRYRVYGNLDSRDAVALTSIMMAKGLSAELIEETPSLALALAARSGQESGPYLRTADGFVLGDLHSISNWIERVHPDPELFPRTPVRRICARLLEDWIEFWLPLWPMQSWTAIEALESNLASAGCLLGASPTRPDWLLAAWLEAEVKSDAKLREHFSKIAPRLLDLGNALLERTQIRVADDAVPIGLLDVLEEIGRDYHQYLALNQSAIKDRDDCVVIDLGWGERSFAVRQTCEARRLEASRDLEGLAHDERQAVRSVLEPVGAWRILTLPEVLEEIDPLDPRSL